MSRCRGRQGTSMGLLIDGVWHRAGTRTLRKGRSRQGGRPLRPRARRAFRNWVTPDGRPGPTGSDGFSAAAGRYHLYVSLACPWAHRTLIIRALKGLEQIVPVSVTHWLMAEHGWTFAPGEGVIPDPLFNSRYLHEIYTPRRRPLHRPRHRPGAVGQAHPDDRQQRIVRNHPDVQQRLRRGGRADRATITRRTSARRSTR